MTSPGKTRKLTTKARDRQATKLHEFVVSRAVSVARTTRRLARVLSQRMLNADGATQLSRELAQLCRLPRAIKDVTPRWSAVWRFQRHFSRTSSGLLHSMPIYQHLSILNSPFSVGYVTRFYSFIRQGGWAYIFFTSVAVSVRMIAKKIV